MLVQRHYRVARGPSARGGEIDLVMRERNGTLVFVEVRARAGHSHGGAAASVGAAKQRSLVFAARHYLARLPSLPPCRFSGRCDRAEPDCAQPLPRRVAGGSMVACWNTL